MASEVGAGGFSGALTGAAAGAVAGGPVGAAIGGGVGLVGGLIGGKGAKGARKAAEAAARARQIEVGKYYDYQQKLADKISTAMNDPNELQALTNSLGAAERDLGRQEQMLNALDPALKEAAAQAMSLLQGNDAASLKPLREDRARKRQSLLDTLRAQLGPGAENSSAGQQALNRFDAESSNLLAQNQQSSLTSVFNIADSGTRYNLNQGINTLSNAANAGFDRSKVGIGMQSDLMRGAFTAKTGVAGSEFIGDLMKGQNQSAVGGSIIGAAGGLAGLGSSLGGIFGGGGGTSTTTAGGMTPDQLSRIGSIA